MFHSQRYSHSHSILKAASRLMLLFSVVAFPSMSLAVDNDFDGDGKSDMSLWRPSNATWYVVPSSGTCPPAMSVFGTGCSKQWGLSTDTPMAADYDGDGKTDFMVVRASGGGYTWYLAYASGAPSATVGFGLTGDWVDKIDYDQDGIKDIAVYRPTASPKPNWYSRNSSNGVTQVFQDSNPDYTGTAWPLSGRWFASPTTSVNHAIVRITSPSSHYIVYRPGFSTDYHFNIGSPSYPVFGDWDGDHKADYMSFNRSTGLWSMDPTNACTPNFAPHGSSPFCTAAWGLANDVPISGDFDGDTQFDLMVWRPSSGTWFVVASSGACPPATAPTGYGGCFKQWGVSGDIAAL